MPRRSRLLLRGVFLTVAALLLASCAVLAWAQHAGAHSFLVSTNPSQGQRLASSPDSVVLEFTEAVDVGTASMELHLPSGEVVEELVPELARGGQAVRASVPLLDDAIYVVSWQALSAVDGHGSSGEFAFAVGVASGDVPASNQSERLEGWSLLATWLFTGGLAAALGSFLLAAVGADRFDLVHRVARPGLVVALVGVAAAAISAGSGMVVLVVVAQMLLAGLVLIGLTGRWWWATVAVVAAAAAWSTRSHGAGDGWVGWIIDFLHLAAGSAWAGSLALVVVVGWLLRRDDRPWLPVVQGYARPALGLVVVLGAAGTAGAVRLVPGWSELWATGYGRAVAAKVLLFTGALIAAAMVRWRGLGGGRPGLARLVMSVEVVLVVAAMGLAGMLAAGAPPQPAGAAERLLGPPPLDGSVARDAGLAGQLNVEVASNGERLQVNVFGPSGPVADTDVQVVVSRPDGVSTDLSPRPCGTGCFTQALDLGTGKSVVAVTASAADVVGGTFRGDLYRPPGPRRPDRLRALVERMRQIPELTLTETVDSGPGSVVRPATFVVDGEYLMAAEPYAGANVERVWVLPGEPERLRLYLPGSNIFAEIQLDEDGRMSQARLVTPGHLITRRFRYPD